METVYTIALDGKPVGICRASEAMGALAWFHHNKPAYSMDHATTHEGYSVTEGEPDCRDVAGILEGIAERTGLTAEFEFVPFSRSRNANSDSGFGDGKPWQSLNWRVTVKRYGRTVLTTDYGQGVAYAPAETNRKWIGQPHVKARAVAIEIETGKIADSLFSQGEPRASARPVPPPRLGDVLQSLASDSRVLDEGTFEDWASGLGYDPDSRKAEAIWKACVEIATALRGSLGGRIVEELQLAAEFN